MSPQIRIKRAYDEASPDDGFRILIDRLWPRGVSKKTFKYDVWVKDLAPSAELRKWFGHDAARWEEFCERYEKELRAKAQVERLQELLSQVDADTVTLLYGARDTEHNNAVVLARELSRIAGSQAKKATKHRSRT